MKWIPIFKAGQHTDSSGKQHSYTVDDLDKMVTLYNEQPDTDKHLAPHILGHEVKSSTRSFGWLDQVRREGETLFGATKEFDPSFVELIKSGAFKFRSLAFDKKGLIRHVAWLGAARPAIAGLGEVHFEAPKDELTMFAWEVEQSEYHEMFGWWAENNFKSAVNMFRKMRDFLIETTSIERANEIMPVEELDRMATTEAPRVRTEPMLASTFNEMKDEPMGTQQPNTKPAAQFAEGDDEGGAGGASPVPPSDGTQAGIVAKMDEMSKTILELKDQVSALKIQNETLQTEAETASFSAYLEGLITEQRILPADKDFHLDQMQINARIGSRQFSDGANENALDRYKRNLSARPAFALFSDATGRRGVTQPVGRMDYGPGTQVDDSRMQLHTQIVKLSKEKQITYEAALAEVSATQEIN